MEYIGLGVAGLGGLIFFIAWIWMIVIGFKQGGALWGVLILFFTWMAGLVFCIMNKTGWIPLVLMIFGMVVAGFGMVPFILKMLENMPQ